MHLPPPPAVTYLQAATAGIRRQTQHTANGTGVPGRVEVDALHAHLVALHGLADQLVGRAADADAPATASDLSAARTRIWQATAHLHDAYHHAPHPGGQQPRIDESCPPNAEPPRELPLLTTCQRHLATSTLVRRQTTPADLHSPLHGHTRHAPADRDPS
ncbi:DUF6238 family protein [Streptomyces carpaticus]|uniref:DUF6238 family protein n=1 Tax=Streptomyces carpaticus TaxID=285558 RepID=UPI00220772A8|nr:DUF6238 family protein [Streptomyces carpaticus]